MNRTAMGRGDGAPAEVSGEAGVRIELADDPPARARQLATALAGLVVDDADATAREVARRARAAARGAGGDAAAALAELRDLAAELERARRVKARTEEAFSGNAARQLGPLVGDGVGAARLRQAAAAVERARTELRAAQEALAAVGPEPAERPVPAPAEEPTPHEPAPAEEQAPHEPAPDEPVPVPAALVDVARVRDRVAADLEWRWAKTNAFVGSTMMVGLGLVVAGTGLGPGWLPGTVFVGAVVAVAVALARGRQRMLAADDLALVGEGEPGSRPDPAPPAERPAVAGEPPGEWRARARWRAERDRRAAQVERAADRLRGAQRSWEADAGTGADPGEVETIVRERTAASVAQAVPTASSPTVKTVGDVHRRALARWQMAWAALGYQEAPPVERAAVAIDDLRQRWSTGHRPLVIAEPAAWISAERLGSLLRQLAPTDSVVIVERRT